MLSLPDSPNPCPMCDNYTWWLAEPNWATGKARMLCYSCLYTEDVD